MKLIFYLWVYFELGGGENCVKFDMKFFRMRVIYKFLVMSFFIEQEMAFFMIFSSFFYDCTVVAQFFFELLSQLCALRLWVCESKKNFFGVLVFPYKLYCFEYYFFEHVRIFEGDE